MTKQLLPASVLENPALENASRDGWPQEVDLKFIVPGLVYYQDLKNTKGETTGGTVLVRKEAFDKMNASAKGKPIVNWDHRKVNANEFDRGTFQGVVTGPAYFNAADGWFHAPALVWNKQTLKNIENGFSVSCAYQPVLDTKAGFYNQVPYQAEVLDGEYTHFAVVSVPRYEEARIELMNSGGNTMGLLSFFRKDKPEEKIDFDPATAKVAVEGSGDVPLAELINSFRATKAANVKVGMEDMIDVDGQKISVKELVNSHAQQLKNSMESEHKEGDHKEKPKDNCGMCNSAEEEKKKKDEEEKKNAAEAEEKKRKDDDERKNSLAAEAAKVAAEKAAAAKKAAELEELRNKGSRVEMPSIDSLKAREAEGLSRYGAKPAAAGK